MENVKKSILRFFNGTYEISRGEKVMVAVSGGGDSMALLYGLNSVASDLGFEIRACTVDHMLRPESSSEAEYVSSVCKNIGVAHETLKWNSGPEKGDNIQEAARIARINLIGSLCLSEGIHSVCLGHNEDDVAETYAMRKTGIWPHISRNGISWFRPIMSLSRDEIRSTLNNSGHHYFDDPSNENEKYLRIQVRKKISSGEISRSEMIRGAEEFIRTRTSLLVEARDFLSENADVFEDGSLVVSVPEYFDENVFSETFKVLVRCFGDKDGRIRPGRMEELYKRIRNGVTSTLCGAIISSKRNIGKDYFDVTVRREPKAFGAIKITPHSQPRNTMIDERWQVSLPEEEGEVFLSSFKKTMGMPFFRSPDGKETALEAKFMLDMSEICGDVFFGPIVYMKKSSDSDPEMSIS